MASDPPLPRARRRLGVGAAIVVVLAALAVTVGIGVVRGVVVPVQDVPVAGEDATVAADAAEQLYVHVAGAVVVPGLYRLPPSSRVVDAIAAAGGFAPDADRTVLNLARTVSDGEQVVVPMVGAVPPQAAPDPGGSGGDGRVDLNTADAAALDTLPRIGPAMAQRILDWRDENGRFTSVDDLLAVPGIGDKMLEALRDLVTV